MTKELTPYEQAIQKAVRPLKEALLNCPLVKSVIKDNREGRFFTVEHNNGIVYTVYPRFIGYTVFNGYSLNQPITPNTHSGSSVSLVGNDENYDTGYSLQEVIETIVQGKKYIPYFFTDSMRQATQHQTWRQVRLSPFHRDDKQIKGDKPSDRDMVNSCIAQDKSYKNSYMQKVSEQFVDEMRDCVPPTFRGSVGPFYYIQVGEATDHKSVNSEYVEVYETYTKAIEQNDITTQYKKDQWYFIGCKPLITQS